MSSSLPAIKIRRMSLSGCSSSAKTRICQPTSRPRCVVCLSFTTYSLTSFKVAFFRAVIDLKPKELKQYGRNYSDAQHTLRTILALDAWTRSGALDHIATASDAEVAEDLLLCWRFGSVVKAVVRNTSILGSANIQHLFGIASAAAQADEAQAQSIDSQRTIQPTSFIHARALAYISHGQQPASKTDPITLPKNTVDDMIRRTLLEQMNAVIDKVDIVARRSRAFEVCTRFLTVGQCADKDGRKCWRDHVPEKALTIQRFNTRFRIHILTISLLDCFTAIDRRISEERSRATKQRWVTEEAFDSALNHFISQDMDCQALSRVLPANE